MITSAIISLIGCIVVFGAVIYASQPTWLLDRWPREKFRPKRQKPLHHHAWQALVVGGTVLGILGGIDLFFGRPWPNSPEIHPHEALNGSSARLPFTIKNTSVWPISNAKMTCGIDWVYITDALNQTAIFSQVAKVNQIISISAGQTVNYECDASEVIKARSDGSWSIGPMAGPGQLHMFPPLNFRKMCLWIRGDYTISALIPWNFTSVVFEWPFARGVPQWLEGPTYRAGTVTRNEWIPRRGELSPDLVTCEPTPQKAGFIYNMDGTATFMGKTVKMPAQ